MEKITVYLYQIKLLLIAQRRFILKFQYSVLKKFIKNNTVHVFCRKTGLRVRNTII